MTSRADVTAYPCRAGAYLISEQHLSYKWRHGALKQRRVLFCRTRGGLSSCPGASAARAFWEDASSQRSGEISTTQGRTRKHAGACAAACQLTLYVPAVCCALLHVRVCALDRAPRGGGGGGLHSRQEENGLTSPPEMREPQCRRHHQEAWFRAAVERLSLLDL